MESIIQAFSLKFCCQQQSIKQKENQYQINIDYERPSLKIIDLKGFRNSFYQSKVRQNKLLICQNKKKQKSQTNLIEINDKQKRSAYILMKRNSLMSSQNEDLQKFNRKNTNSYEKQNQNRSKINRRSFLQSNKKINITCSRQKTVILGGRRKSFTNKIKIDKNINQALFKQQRFSFKSDFSYNISTKTKELSNIKTNIQHLQCSNMTSNKKNDQRTLYSTTLEDSNKFQIQLGKTLINNQSIYVQNFRVSFGVESHMKASQNYFTSSILKNQNKENCQNSGNHSKMVIEKQEDIKKNKINLLKNEIFTLGQNLQDLKYQQLKLIYQLNQQKDQFKEQYNKLTKKITKYHQNEKQRLQQIEQLKKILGSIHQG